VILSDVAAYAGERARVFTARLRKIRERRGLTQAELGRMAGLSSAAISQLETGSRRPNFTTLVCLSRALETTPNALLGVVDEVSGEPYLQQLLRKIERLSSEEVTAVEGFVDYLDSKRNEV
jgi:transcriptional regulator with XRE-family HTH domain